MYEQSYCLTIFFEGSDSLTETYESDKPFLSLNVGEGLEVYPYGVKKIASISHSLRADGSDFLTSTTYITVSD